MYFEKNHFAKFKMAANQPIHFTCYLVNRARLDHYYKTKCVISGEDASWKNLT